MTRTHATGGDAGAGAGADRSLAGLIGTGLGRLGRAGGLVFVLVGLTLSGFGAHEGAYAAGWAGVKGTLTVQQCEVMYPGNAARSSRKNRRPVRCEGIFVSADGRSTDARAAVRVRQRYAVGTELAVQRTEPPDAGEATGAAYVHTGVDRAWRWFAAFFGGWVFMGLGVFCLATGFASFGRSRLSFDAAWDAAGQGATRSVVIGMIGVGVVGAGVSFLISYFV